jgi:hypothetical protein
LSRLRGGSPNRPGHAVCWSGLRGQEASDQVEGSGSARPWARLSQSFTAWSLDIKRAPGRLARHGSPVLRWDGGGVEPSGGNGGADSATVGASADREVPVACDLNTTTNAANRNYAQPVCSALDGSRAFLQVSNGFSGTPSDGLVQLDASRALTTLYTDAQNGNVVQTAYDELRRLVSQLSRPRVARTWSLLWAAPSSSCSTRSVATAAAISQASSLPR